jgi:hypothetical protein
MEEQLGMNTFVSGEFLPVQIAGKSGVGICYVMQLCAIIIV